VLTDTDANQEISLSLRNNSTVHICYIILCKDGIKMDNCLQVCFFICNQLIIYLGQLSHLPLVGLEVNTGKEALAMLCSQKGNCKSVVSLAMHHRLWYITSERNSLQRDGHPVYTLVRHMASIILNHMSHPFFFIIIIIIIKFFNKKLSNATTHNRDTREWSMQYRL